MDPRFKQRLIKIRRDQGKKRLLLLGSILVTLVLGAGAFVALHSPLLRVRSVQVHGDVPRTAVLAVTGLDHEQEMIDVSTSNLVARLESYPWVRSARVTKSWPAAVSITVSRRLGVAEVAPRPGAPPVALVDSTGRLLTRHLPLLSSLPLVYGVRLPEKVGGYLAGSPGYGKPVGSPATMASVGSQLVRPGSPLGGLLAVAGSLPPPRGLAEHVRYLTVEGRSRLEAVLAPEKVTVLLGGPTDLAEKVASLRAVMSQVQLAGASSINLTEPERPEISAGHG